MLCHLSNISSISTLQRARLLTEVIRTITETCLPIRPNESILHSCLAVSRACWLSYDLDFIESTMLAIVAAEPTLYKSTCCVAGCYTMYTYRTYSIHSDSVMSKRRQ